jgi:hypothetical protein
MLEMGIVSLPCVKSSGNQVFDEPISIAALATPDMPPSGARLSDTFLLGSQEDGTWGVGWGLFQRRPLDESDFIEVPDRFMQGMLSYDQYDRWRDRYTSTQALLRVREQSGPTFGLAHEDWQPLDRLVESIWPHAWCSGACDRDRLACWQAGTEWYGYLQRPSDPIGMHDEDTELSLGGRVRLSTRDDVTQFVHHTFALSAFGRWLSLDEPAYLPGRVDQDVFTTYKSDHRHGLTLNDTWVYQRDDCQRLWLRPALMTNEDWNIYQPDNISLQTGWDALLGDVLLGLSYRLTSFRDDGDRRRTSEQNLLQLSAALDLWQHAGDWYQIDLDVRHDVDEGETSAYLTLSRFVSAGRGYEDMSPRRTAFLKPRARRHYQDWAVVESRYR